MVSGRPGELASDVSSSDVHSDVTDNVIISKMMGRKRRLGAKIRYAHRSSNNTPSLDIMPWEDAKAEPGSKKPEVTSGGKPLSTKGVSHVKERVVKKLTIRMPEVPPPSPEDKVTNDVAWPGKRNSQVTFENCQVCESQTPKNLCLNRQVWTNSSLYSAV